MFRKQFKVKSNTHVKGSERKKIRTEIGSHFPQLTDEDLSNLFPNKEAMTTMKIMTHCGESVIVYSVDKIPMVFEMDKIVYPTVYMLWKYPNLLYTFTTHPVVFSKLVSGADLMLPGIVIDEPYTIKSFGKLKKGDMVAINLTDNMAPIAIGTAALSSFDMYMSAKRGKGVLVLHYNGDFLCASQKLCPPNLGPPCIPLARGIEADDMVNMNDPCTNFESDDKACDSITVSERISSNSNDPCQKSESFNEEASLCDAPAIGEDEWANKIEGLSLENNDLAQDHLGIEPQEKDLAQLQETFNDAGVVEPCPENYDNPEQDAGCNSLQESMDKLIEYCFLKALKTTAKKLTLPLLTSNFFKVHMIPACPKGEVIDVKKSTYKKLSKFLKEMERNNIIEIKELTKGVESIVSVNYCHPMLKLFVEDTDDTEYPLDASSTKTGEVNEMFVINASTLPIFRTFGYKKGESIMGTSIRQHLTEYVMKNDLQSSDDKRFVKLDHTLSSCLRLKEEEVVTWKELMTSCLERMGNSYSIGQSGSINKGKLKPIEITVATRTGNKKVTLINNLDLYGINTTEFVKKCQHGVAASATITQLSGTKSAQVMVQGNQVLFLEKLLTGEYQIHKRFIRGLENAPKMKKPKQPINK